jgi:hypothetical protein
MNLPTTHADVAAANLSGDIYTAIAACDSAGNPCRSPAYYAATSDLDFIFISPRRSKLATNIRKTGRGDFDFQQCSQ